MDPLCRNSIPWACGRHGLGYESTQGQAWEWRAPPPALHSRLLRTHLDDVVGEGVPEHPVQGDALVLQNVLPGSKSRAHALPTPAVQRAGAWAWAGSELWRDSSAPAYSHSHFTDGQTEVGGSERLARGLWARQGQSLGETRFPDTACPLTCRLPRGQYSVRIQMLGGSVQAPTNRVRCSFCTSRICRWEPAEARLLTQRPPTGIPSLFLIPYSCSADLLGTPLVVPACSLAQTLLPAPSASQALWPLRPRVRPLEDPPPGPRPPPLLIHGPLLPPATSGLRTSRGPCRAGVAGQPVRVPPAPCALPRATSSLPHVTCFSSNRTFLVSSMRLRFTRFTTTRLPWAGNGETVTVRRWPCALGTPAAAGSPTLCPAPALAPSPTL